MSSADDQQDCSLKSALFIGPHPDDVEIGAGSTISKLVSQGWDCHVLVVTTPSDETIGETRRRECKNACAHLGVAQENLKFLNFTDGALNQLLLKDVKQAIYNIIKELNPTLVFAPSKYDQNEDHKVVYEATCEAARTRGILHYYVLNHLKTDSIRKIIGVQIDQHIQSKKDAYFSHETQFSIGTLSEKRFDALIALGKGDGGRHYEFFDVTRPLAYGERIFDHALSIVNDHHFGRFWSTALNLESESRSLHVLRPAYNGSGRLHEVQACDKLCERLRNAFPTLDLQTRIETSADQVRDIGNLIAHNNCLFSAGPIANPWVHRFIHGYDAFTYRQSQFVRNVSLANVSPPFTALSPTVKKGASAESDVGVVVVMSRP